MALRHQATRLRLSTGLSNVGVTVVTLTSTVSGKDATELQWGQETRRRVKAGMVLSRKLAVKGARHGATGRG